MVKATYFIFLLLFINTRCKKSHPTNNTKVWKPPSEEEPTRSPLRIFTPANRTDFKYSWDDDNKFFDRVVMIRVDALSNSEYILDEIIAPGVFFTERHVLTTYNPFRTFLKKLKYFDIVVATLRNRGSGLITHQRINCARQIIPTTEEEVRPEAWHGQKNVLRHNAVHDLMIAEVAGTMWFRNIDPVQELPDINNTISLYYDHPAHDFFDPNERDYYKTPDGPYIVPIASANDYLGPALSFASIGFLDLGHIKRSNELRAKTYTADYGLILDCEEWFLADWGHFICIRDDDHFKGIGSGAMLIFNNTLFGVGSFTLMKNNVSVLVFTDVRVYSSYLNGTCSDEDLENRRKNFYDTRTANFHIPITKYQKINDGYNETDELEWWKATYHVFSM